MNLFSKLKQFLRCKICWLISISLLLTFVIVEVVLLTPLYKEYKQQQLDNLTQYALDITRAMISLASPASDAEKFIQLENTLVKNTPIRGIIIYNVDGKVLIHFGQTSTILPIKMHRFSPLAFSYPMDSYLIKVWNPHDLGSPYKIIAKLDRNSTNYALKEFLRRYWNEMLINALLLTFATSLLIYLLILQPLLQAKKQLAIAYLHPNEPRRYLLKYKKSNEIQDFFQKINKLLLKNNFFINRLQQQEQKLKEYNISLERKIAQRTHDLAEKNQQLEYISTHDAVTKLTNRRLFEDLLTQSIQKTNDAMELIAILYIEINDFKKINQNLGHAGGEQLLRLIAQRLQQNLSKQMILAHLSDNHFAVALLQLANVELAGDYAQQLLLLFREAFFIDHRSVYISINIGIAFYPLDAKVPIELIKNADVAAFHASEKGQNQYQFYTIEMNKQLSEKHRLYQDLHNAVTNNEFEFYYQPKLDIKNNKIIGAEALIRWIHPTLGMISPVEFIPLLEQSHLINEVTLWSLENISMQFKEWRNEQLPIISVAINLTSQQFNQENLVGILENFIQSHQFPANLLELEITERTAVLHPEATINNMQKIRALGIKIAIDDFGTDYSSLRYLQQLPVDYLKIDKIFLDEFNINENSTWIINAIIDLAHRLNLKVIAEGVETDQQFKFLLANHCDQIQGYYLSRPLAAKEFAIFVKNYLSQHG